MVKAREDMVDWLVEDSADTCRQDEGYMRSILRQYWNRMPDEELRRSFRELASDDGEPEHAEPAGQPTANLRFRPQAWVNDYAISVDPKHPDIWEVPVSLLLQRFPTEQDWNDRHYDRDDLRYEPTAPRWIQEWSGPFEVELVEGEYPWEIDAGQ